MEIYTCKHFIIQELVPEHVLNDRGIHKPWELLDPRALITLDALRDKFGSCTVNNWKWGGNREWSGLRTEQSPYGTQYSQHRFGRAFDCIFADHTAEEVRTYVMANPEEFPHIGAIELGTSWFHFDCRNCNGIMAFNP
tara:strand:+ start:313 stop:726 length:414 start_codon:yes stop_codon:yes gene_type:complete